MFLSCRQGRRAALLGAIVLGVGLCGCDTAEPAGPMEPEECEAQGGHVIGDPGDGSTDEEGCPEGETFLGHVHFGIEGGICCRDSR